MKVVGLVVVVISIGSSVVAAPSSNSAAASASTAASAASRDDSELERRKLGYAAVPNFNATPLLFYAIVQMHFNNFFCFFATFYLLFIYYLFTIMYTRNYLSNMDSYAREGCIPDRLRL